MKRCLPPIVVFLATCATVFAPPNPAWWTNSGTRILDPNVPDTIASHYSPANQGQLKNVAARAMEHLDNELPGGAGTAVRNVVNGFAREGELDYSPVNLGQLMAVAKPFYDRLLSRGYSTKANLISRGYPPNWAHNYPWPSGVPVSQNYAPANLGQLLAVFSFDVVGYNPEDTDADGLPDYWEMEEFGNLSHGVTGDSDGDGLSNSQEQSSGSSTGKKDHSAVNLNVTVIAR